MTSRLYRILEHSSDTGFEVRGATKAQVFEHAATAFFSILWRLGSGQENEWKNIVITGNDLEELLVNFLEEFLYLYDAKRLVCREIKVERVSDNRVDSRARLQKFDETGDEELLGVKAVTYHQLYIGREDDAWKARVFLDI